MMKRTNKVHCQTDKLRYHNNLCCWENVEDDEAEMEDERVDRQNETVWFLFPFPEVDDHAENGEEEDND